MTSQEEPGTARDQILSNPEPTEVGALLEELHAGIRSAKRSALWRKVSERALQLAADTITRLAAEVERLTEWRAEFEGDLAKEKTAVDNAVQFSLAQDERIAALTARAEAAESSLTKAEARVRRLEQAARDLSGALDHMWNDRERCAFNRIKAHHEHALTAAQQGLRAALTNSRSEDA